MPFSDVFPTDWFYHNVVYVFNKGLMKGTTATTFSPQQPTTRAMIVAIPHRQEGSPAATPGEAFTDVAASQYYAGSVAWASANKIVSGYGNGKFGPNDSLTREQLVSILYRYAQFKKYDTTGAADLGQFSDAKSVAAYAKPAMAWAVKNGIVSGMADGTLAPQGKATRAQLAALLERYLATFAK